MVKNLQRSYKFYLFFEILDSHKIRNVAMAERNGTEFTKVF